MNHIYRCELCAGHVIASDNEACFLIDTGAPSSICETSVIHFASRDHAAQKRFRRLSCAALGAEIGKPIHALVGADILSRYDMVIDLATAELTFSDEALSFDGDSLELDECMGIPILQAVIEGRTIRMFFDTGARLSYLAPEIGRAFPDAGPEQDFYPGVGRFQTETRRVPITLGKDTIELRVGELPPLMQVSLMMAETSGILGTAILESHSVCFAPRRRALILKRRSA